MSQNAALVPNSQDDMLISEHDHRAWERVQRVTQAWTKGALNTTHACKIAEVCRSQYYLDLKVPFVQERLLEQTKGITAATQELIEDQYLRVVRNMLKVAQGDSRESVAAARWVDSVYSDIRAIREAIEEGRDDAAATFLQQFASRPESLGKRTITVRKKSKGTDIEATVEIPPGNEGMPGDA